MILTFQLENSYLHFIWKLLFLFWFLGNVGQENFKGKKSQQRICGILLNTSNLFSLIQKLKSKREIQRNKKLLISKNSSERNTK